MFAMHNNKHIPIAKEILKLQLKQAIFLVNC